jgi:hypothetical protein
VKLFSISLRLVNFLTNKKQFFQMSKLDSKELAKKLANNDPSITKLELGNKGITGEFLCDIMPALDFNTKVTFVDLSDNNIDGKYFNQVKETFLRNQTIETFWFQGNNSTEESCHQLIEGLQENFTLTDFQLDKNKMDYDDDENYDEYMERNQAMKVENNKTIKSDILPRGQEKKEPIKVEEKKNEPKPVSKPVSKPINKNTNSVSSNSSGGFVKPPLKATGKLPKETVNESSSSSGGWVKPELKSTNSPFKTTGTSSPAPKSSTPPSTVKSPTFQTSSNVWNYSGPLANEIKRIRTNDKYLNKLSVASKKVTDDTAKEIFAALENNKVLKKLDLQNNLLTDDVTISVD